MRCYDPCYTKASRQIKMASTGLTVYMEYVQQTRARKTRDAKCCITTLWKQVNSPILERRRKSLPSGPRGTGIPDRCVEGLEQAPLKQDSGRDKEGWDTGKIRTGDYWNHSAIFTMVFFAGMKNQDYSIFPEKRKHWTFPLRKGENIHFIFFKNGKFLSFPVLGSTS